MKERPILFKGEMVRAILDGRKTQTRRVIKPQSVFHPDLKNIADINGGFVDHSGQKHSCKFGSNGDRLWVRETCKEDAALGSISIARYSADNAPVCRQDGSGVSAGWWYSKQVCPSIFMPKKYARIWLEIAGVRIERLQDISEEDAKAEGIASVPFRPDDGWPLCDGFTFAPQNREALLHACAKDAFQELWQSINGSESWDSNPWVWVIEFKRVMP